MTEISIYGEHFFCSWSGGKDSALAYYRAVKEGGRPGMLLTMTHETQERTRAHGLPLSVLKAQGSALGVPIMFRGSTWEGYEEVFIEALVELKTQGITVGVFGDIDLDEHREWVHKVCARADVTPCHPLWHQDRKSLLNELVREGFEATIISVKKGTLDSSFLGRRLNNETIAALEAAGVDASGELGEYHTVVTNGPLFSRPLQISTHKVHEHEGYLFLEVSLPGVSSCLDSTEVRGG